MSKIDYEYKAKVLTDHQDILKFQKQFSREAFLVEHLLNYDDSTYYEFLKKISVLHEDEELWRAWQEAEKINHASYKRNKRLKDTIEQMLWNGDCYFLTLTFSDLTFKRVSDKVRRRYVSYALKNIAADYVANIDYGELNGREHYHAVIQSDIEPDLSAWSRFGFYHVQKVRSDDDFIKLGKYVGKLTNHAIKNTTRGARIIYSRKVLTK